MKQKYWLRVFDALALGSTKSGQEERAQPSSGERLTMGDDGLLDEIVLNGTAHLERMDDGQFYLGLYRPDGSGWQVWLYAKRGKLLTNHEEMARDDRKQER